jgi:hypothetical protein
MIFDRFVERMFLAQDGANQIQRRTARGERGYGTANRG